MRRGEREIPRGPDGGRVFESRVAGSHETPGRTNSLANSSKSANMDRLKRSLVGAPGPAAAASLFHLATFDQISDLQTALRVLWNSIQEGAQQPFSIRRFIGRSGCLQIAGRTLSPQKHPEKTLATQAPQQCLREWSCVAPSSSLLGQATSQCCVRCAAPRRA